MNPTTLTAGAAHSRCLWEREALAGWWLGWAGSGDSSAREAALVPTHATHLGSFTFLSCFPSHYGVFGSLPYKPPALRLLSQAGDTSEGGDPHAAPILHPSHKKLGSPSFPHSLLLTLQLRQRAWGYC